MNKCKKIIKIVVKNITYYLLRPFMHSKSVISYQDAMKTITDASPNPFGKIERKNRIVDSSYNLQIIIPCYNVERYISDCINSILNNKTTYKYLIVAINDGSTDGTLEILNKYRNHPNVIIIDQANKGFSGARNSGLENIFSDYIMFVDSDDTIEPISIQALLDEAYKNDADIVEGGANSLVKGKKEIFFSWKENKQLESSSQLNGVPWGKIYKSTLWGNYIFPEGYWFEDTINRFIMFPQAKKSYCIKEIVYNYRFNQNSISNTFKGKAKTLDTFYITEMLLNEAKKRNYTIPLSELNNQLINNGRRLLGLSDKIQEAVMICTQYLLKRLIEDRNSIKKYKILNYVWNNDFSAYKHYLKFKI